MLFIARRPAKPTTFKCRSMNPQELIHRSGRLSRVETLDHSGIGIAWPLALAAQDPECLHVDADGLCCHACTMHAPRRRSMLRIPPIVSHSVPFWHTAFF